MSYVQDVVAMGLASQFFEFLSLEHSNNNVHNIRLCRQIISSNVLPASQLHDMAVAEKVRGARGRGEQQAVADQKYMKGE